MASESPIQFQVDPGKVLQTAIERALQEVKDLSVPFTLITRDWFQSNKAIFTLQGPGKYVDLSERYKKQKQKAVGFIYPILKRSGLLADSITLPGDKNSINLIINGVTLVLGTSVKYAPYHQFGTKYLPVRPVIFTSGEGSVGGDNDQFNRSGAWAKILMDYVLQVSSKVGKVTP